MYKLLSYMLSNETPLFGETAPVVVSFDKKISANDSCNSATVSFSGHSGTHIDAPRHFYQDGRSISQYRIDELIFNHPQLIDCVKGDNELIDISDLESIGDCDLLLIRTGFYKFRSEKRYRINNPGISVAAAEWLRQAHPHIKAIGIDSISISGFQMREEGRNAHRMLLGDNIRLGAPVLLIEDMDLSFMEGKLKKVYVFPLFIEGPDSLPCTIVGEF